MQMTLLDLIKSQNIAKRHKVGEVSPYDFTNQSFDLDLIKNNISAENIKSDVVRYLRIMDKVRSTDVSRDDGFQKQYTAFYKVRRSRERFLRPYYKYMEECKKAVLSFREILDTLYRYEGKIEPSFASKLLHTVDPWMPIWDSYIIKRLGFKKISRSLPAEDRIEMCAKRYKEIELWYQEIISSDDTQKAIIYFNNTYPKALLTDLKKIDFIIWGIR